MQSFDEIFILDLHGNVMQKEKEFSFPGTFLSLLAHLPVGLSLNTFKKKLNLPMQDTDMV